MKGKIFKAQEVQAIIAGNKTMSREVIKPQPIQPEGFSDAYFDCYNKGNQWNWWAKDNKQLLGQIVKCPYQVGQKIFCKEGFNIFAGQVSYKQDLVGAERYFWRPAQHMKQEHSRLTLLIKEIRVERLAEISCEDCLLEGIESYYTDGAFHMGLVDEIEAFQELWNATHKKPEEKFEANPFVFVYRFELIKLNEVEND